MPGEGVGERGRQPEPSDIRSGVFLALVSLCPMGIGL